MAQWYFPHLCRQRQIFYQTNFVINMKSINGIRSVNKFRFENISKETMHYDHSTGWMTENKNGSISNKNNIFEKKKVVGQQHLIIVTMRCWFVLKMVGHIYFCRLFSQWIIIGNAQNLRSCKMTDIKFMRLAKIHIYVCQMRCMPMLTSLAKYTPN